MFGMSRHYGLATAIAVLFLSAPLGAQNSPATTGTESAPTVATQPANAGATAAPVRSLAPTRVGTAFGVRATETAFGQPSAPPAPPTSRNMALMIVGGAALLVGAVVGGDSGTIIMIGGGVVGLVGLWNYLK